MEKANIFVFQLGTQMVCARQEVIQSCLNVCGYLLRTAYAAFKRRRGHIEKVHHGKAVL